MDREGNDLGVTEVFYSNCLEGLHKGTKNLTQHCRSVGLCLQPGHPDKKCEF
jgi:hypothetical protein